MGTFKIIGLGVLSALIIISLSLTVFLASFSILLHPAVYENALEKTNAYDSLKSTLLEGAPPELNITTDVIKQSLNSIIENSISYVRGDSADLNLKISLEGQSFDVGKSLGMEIDTATQAKTYIHYAKIAFYSFVAFSFILLAIIFFVSGGIQGFSRWAGIDFFISGTSIIIAGFASSSVITNQLNASLNIDLIKNIAEAITGDVLLRMKIYGFVFLVAGILLFVISLVKGKEKR